ncbi:MAG: M24 family metallopeptidase, partial [Alphaproteobacteria bacterium]
AIIRDKVPDVRHVGYSDGVEPIPPARTPDADLVLVESQTDEATAGLRPWSTSLGIPIRGADGEPPPVSPSAAVTCSALIEAGLKRARLGIEKAGSFLPFGIAEAVMQGLPEACFEDASDLVADCRSVQSPRELAYTRKAAAVSESMMLAGIAAAGPGVHKRDVVAAIYQTMFSRGGTYPGFVPLVRSTHTLEHEHGPWEDDRLVGRDVLLLELSGCVHRYHAPISRLVFIGKTPARAERIRRVCEEAIESAEKTIRPGASASEVYDAWQRRVDEAGLTGYRRHHCGYSVGIGFPPSWTGSGVPLGLRAGSSMELRAGMVFHLMSWLLRTGRGDFVISDTIVVTETGCEVLTNVSRGLIVR